MHFFIKRLIPALCAPLALVAIQACAQDDATADATPDQPVIEQAAVAENTANDNAANDQEFAVALEALNKLLPEDQPIETIKKSVVPGLLEISVGTGVFYASEDGRFFIQGDAYDTVTRENVTDVSRRVLRGDLIKSYGPETAIMFPAENEQYRIMVFTDIDCGYCRKLHRDMEGYNERGITVEYLFFPRSGPGTESWAKAQAVWCADSRQVAMNEAKAGMQINSKSCENTPVAAHYKLGKDLGVTGTPAIFTESGDLIPGYRSPEELETALLELAGS